MAESEVEIPVPSPDWARKLKSSLTKPYRGDLYTTRASSGYNEGIIYLSRMTRPTTAVAAAATTVPRDSKEEEEDEEMMDELFKGLSTVDDGLDHLKSKKRCAAALARMTERLEIAGDLVKAGALDAIMVLLGIADDVTLANCAVALCNLAHDPEVAKFMNEKDVAFALGHLALCENQTTRYNAAVTLCLLSAIPGYEHRIVIDGRGVDSTMVLKSSSTTAVTELVCALTLLNLSCVDRASSKSVDAQLITALINFITSNAGNQGIQQVEVRNVCLRALLNISSRKASKAQLLSEGVIPLIVSCASKETFKNEKVAFVYARLLCNLSFRPLARPAVMLPAVLTLIELTKVDDEKTQEEAALTLGNMAWFQSNQMFLVNNGASTALLKLTKDGGTETKRRAISALKSMLYYEEGQRRLVSEGIITKLVALMAPGEDMVVRESCVEALCSLLCSKEQAGEVVTANGLDAIVSLAIVPGASDSLLRQCAHALFNLSCFSNSLAMIALNKKIVPAIREIALHGDMETLRLTAILVRNLTCTGANQRELVSQGLEKVCITLLRSGGDEVSQSAAASLYYLSSDVTSSKLLVEGGVLPELISLAHNANKESNIWAAVVICSLTYHEELQPSIVEQGIVGALMELAAVCEDPPTMTRIAAALCNLSSTLEAPRRKMLDDGALTSIVGLASNYNNTIQQDCARSLCNLSFITGVEQLMVKQGAIKTLMVIGLVWTDDSSTRILCAKALSNILTNESIHHELLEDGVISAFVTWAQDDSMELQLLCSKALCNLSFHKDARQRLAKSRNLSAIIAIATNDANTDAQELAIITLSNLFYHFRGNFAEAAVAQGMIEAINRLAASASKEIIRYVSMCASVMSCNAKAAVAMVKDRNVMISLGTFAKDSHNYLEVASTIVNLGREKSNRALMTRKGAVEVINVILDACAASTDASSSTLAQTFKLASAAIYILSADPAGSSRDSIVASGSVIILTRLLASSVGITCGEGRETVIETLCNLSWEPKSIGQLASEGGIRAIIQGAIATISPRTKLSCVAALANLTYNPEAQTALMNEGCMEVFLEAIRSSTVKDDECARLALFGLRNISAYKTHRALLLMSTYTAVAVPKARQLLKESPDSSPRHIEQIENILVTLTNITFAPHASAMIGDDATTLIIAFSRLKNWEIKELCALALSNLQPGGRDMKLVGALINLSGAGDSEFTSSAAGDGALHGDIASGALLPRASLTSPDSDFESVIATLLVAVQSDARLPYERSSMWEKFEGGNSATSVLTPRKVVPVPKAPIRVEESDADDEVLPYNVTVDDSSRVKVNLVTLVHADGKFKRKGSFIDSFNAIVSPHPAGDSGEDHSRSSMLARMDGDIPVAAIPGVTIHAVMLTHVPHHTSVDISADEKGLDVPLLSSFDSKPPSTTARSKRLTSSVDSDDAELISEGRDVSPRSAASSAATALTTSTTLSGMVAARPGPKGLLSLTRNKKVGPVETNEAEVPGIGTKKAETNTSDASHSSPAATLAVSSPVVASKRSSVAFKESKSSSDTNSTPMKSPVKSRKAGKHNPVGETPGFVKLPMITQRSCAAAGCRRTAPSKMLYCSEACEQQRGKRILGLKTISTSLGLRSTAETSSQRKKNKKLAGSKSTPALGIDDGHDDAGDAESRAETIVHAQASWLSETSADSDDIVSLLYNNMFATADGRADAISYDRSEMASFLLPVEMGKLSVPRKSRTLDHFRNGGVVRRNKPAYLRIYGAESSTS